MDKRSTLIFVRLLTILLLLLSFGNNIAQTDTIPEKDIINMSLEELLNLKVITASKNLQNAGDAPSSIIVITEEDIKTRNYQSLADVFYDLPGFKVDFGVDPRWMNDISIRGIRGMDKFLIMLDGVRISSPTNDIIPVMENFPVNTAKQIEIVYGPASALYGADAFSGVINIITKVSKENILIESSLQGGLFNTVLGNFFISKKVSSNIGYTISGQYFYDQQPDLAEYYPSEYLGMDTSLRSGTFNTILGVMTPKTDVIPEKAHPLSAYGIYAAFKLKYLKFSYFGNHSQNPSTTANSPHNSVYNKDVKFEHYVNTANIKYERPFKNINSSSNLTFSHYYLNPESNFRNVWVNMEPAYLFAYGYMLSGEQLLKYKLSENLNFTGGAVFSYFESMPRTNDLQSPINISNMEDAVIVNTITDNNPEGLPANLIKTNYNNIGGLLQIQYKPLNKLFLTLGTRIDKDSRFEVKFNPRVGLVFQPINQLSIKAMYGSAFLAPSPQYTYDRYGTFYQTDQGTGYASDFFQMPNPNLKAQDVKNCEFAIISAVNKDLILSLRAYYSDITGLINPVTDSLKIAELYYNEGLNSLAYESIPVTEMQINDNLGISKIYGINFTADYQFSINSNRFKFITSYGFIDGIIDVDEQGPVAERNLPGISQHTLKIGLTYYFKSKFSFSTRFIALSNQRTFNAESIQKEDETKYREIGGFELLNATLNYNLKNFTFYIQASNILNQRYRNVNIGASPESVTEGSSAAEFLNGAPQNPFRLIGGVKFRISK